MKIFALVILVFFSMAISAQIPDAVYSSRIKSVQLYSAGNQLGAPVIRLNSSEQLELHFDLSLIHI